MFIAFDFSLFFPSLAFYTHWGIASKSISKMPRNSWGLFCASVFCNVFISGNSPAWFFFGKLSYSVDPPIKENLTPSPPPLYDGLHDTPDTTPSLMLQSRPDAPMGWTKSAIIWDMPLYQKKVYSININYKLDYALGAFLWAVGFLE